MYFGHLDSYLTYEERKFIEELQKVMDHQGVSLPKAISEMYVVKKFEEMTEKIIKSNDLHSKWMKWLTFALVLASFFQVLALFLKK